MQTIPRGRQCLGSAQQRLLTCWWHLAAAPNHTQLHTRVQNLISGGRHSANHNLGKISQRCMCQVLCLSQSPAEEFALCPDPDLLDIHSAIERSRSDPPNMDRHISQAAAHVEILLPSKIPLTI